MGARLPPGEAKRRADERRRKFWAGETYTKVEPGNESEWKSAAASFVDEEFLAEAMAYTGPTLIRRNRAKGVDSTLALLHLTEDPNDRSVLLTGYRNAVKVAFRAAGFNDNDPNYIKKFMKITQAYDRMRTRKGWR